MAKTEYKFFVTTFMLDLKKQDKTFKLRNRTVAYYDTIEKARRCVKENWGDIYEYGHYNYVVIEPLEAGLYPVGKIKKNEWYSVRIEQNGKFHKYKVKKVKCPKHYENVFGFAYG